MRMRRLKTLAILGTAAAIFITISVFYTNFMLSMPVAAGYFLLAAWIVPAAFRRLR